MTAPRQDAPAERLAEAVRLVAASGEAALGTTTEDCSPFVTGAAYLFEPSAAFGTIWVFLSDLARHSRYLRERPHVCLFVATPDSIQPIQGRARVTILGEAREETEAERITDLRRRYRQRFPGSETFLALGDFRFYRIEPREIHWILGFGRAQSLHLEPGGTDRK